MFADKNVKRMKIVLDAYNWRAHIEGKATETRGNEIMKPVETQTLWGYDVAQAPLHGRQARERSGMDGHV